MKRKLFIAGAILLVLIAASFYWLSGSEDTQDIIVGVKQGDFEITVNSTGELNPLRSVSIFGPKKARNSGVREMKILRMVAEGTVVKEGDFIAELDRAELFNKLKEAQDQLIKEEAQFTQAQLDTALQLREARDKILNLEFAVEEKEIRLEQSTYEPPATIKQAEIELEKAKRDFRQAKENYKIKTNQSRAKMTEAAINLGNVRQKVEFIQEILDGFTINAPQAGMVIYARDWGGKKIREGSTVYTWNPEVATLPDLTKMISKTYINEVDIMKITKGQHVKIGIDAFPEKRLSGEVVSVANVGEQKPNSDAKVFEVEIMVNEMDTTLRPAMTTSNLIICETEENAMHIPLECLHNEGDSISYVYKKGGMGITKQEVLVGKSNDNEVIIKSGLQIEDQVFLSTPEGMADSKINLLTPSEKNLAMEK
ncbi:efflux RND transporter periplasmic adaptor subunit [Rapidithrix thailandica]|uniref:Efflux RND transporter periplasmic adaptor subunit n=1 Tax=Rapidithrix thailandica TaxID=413964 RepID=A0AAW9S2A2_9BACT